MGQLKQIQDIPITNIRFWSLGSGNGAKAGTPNPRVFTAGLDNQAEGLEAQQPQIVVGSLTEYQGCLRMPHEGLTCK
jgi:hypothetical protein